MCHFREKGRMVNKILGKMEALRASFKYELKIEMNS